MKPKFALDLSHEGINLLHRRKGGWSLMGTVDLDDPEMGAHLADLRRRAAALESGGLTCKIIIPNSQVLYTTLEAPGPDDIAREVQIRSGLDGLTPYPVGELVFDWRAAGERARVAVLARETMDEAETFAVEHRFNPVSFVARPPAGEFSGEPFFGKTRAATKILGPTERVEPDASPVPRKPPTMEPSSAPAPSTAPAMGTAQEPDYDPAPHSPGELAWHPAADPAPAQPAPSASPASPPVSGRDPDFEPEKRAVPARPDPSDDPFAELDAIQAELSGDLSATPAFRPRSARPQGRSARPASATDQPVAPPLAPFPPTSDEADAMPAPPAAGPAPGKTKAQPSAAATERPGGQGVAPRGPDDRHSSEADAPGKAPSRPPSASGPEDDTPASPGVAFSTRRNGGHTTTTATPTARSASADADRDADTRAKVQPASAPPAPPPQRQPRKEGSPADRRRADMADALSRPLPSGNGTFGKGPKAPDKPAGRSLSEAVRGAAGGLRSFGQKRAPSTADDARDGTRKDRPEKPADSSMTALMRGAGSREARISPDQYADEPDLLAPGVAANEAADGGPRVVPPPTPATPRTDKPAAASAPVHSDRTAPSSACSSA